MGQNAQPQSQTTDAMMKDYVANLDQFMAATNRNMLPNERATLDTAREINPAQQQLNLDIARQFMPQFTQVGLDQQRQQSMGQASNDAALLAGPGQDLVKANLAAQQLADPEYFKSRAGASDQLARLFNSLDDPNGGLSATERAEIDRSLARDNSQRGIEAPTATSAVESAMKFGSAGQARKQSKQQAINAAVQTAGNVMPGLKSGVDVLQLTTGRPSQANNGLTRFGDNQQVGGTTQSMANNLFGQIGDNSRQTADINSKKRTAFDSVMSTMDSTAGLLKSI